MRWERNRKAVVVSLAMAMIMTLLSFSPSMAAITNQPEEPLSGPMLAMGSVARAILKILLVEGFTEYVKYLWRTSCGPGCRTEVRVEYCRQKGVSGNACVRALQRAGLW